MRRKIVYALILVLVFIVIGGLMGIRWFHNMWFEESPIHLEVSIDSLPINFVWSEGTYGNFHEAHAAISIPAKFEGLGDKLYLQFDTGSPNTIIYANTFHSLREYGLKANVITHDSIAYINSLNFNLGGVPIKMDSILLLQDYGEVYSPSDTINKLNIGTVGADLLSNHITKIDFKNATIQLYANRPEWMASLGEFQPFDFQGRRFMLPAVIASKNLELFYDSGSSAFGLITSKDRYEQFTDLKTEEIIYDANKFGDPIPIRHKATNQNILIGGSDLNLKRVSYVDIYPNLQKYMSPFTKIGGWLGNKAFLESTLILDAKMEEFIITDSQPN